jgi:hypothetical protein
MPAANKAMQTVGLEEEIGQADSPRVCVFWYSQTGQLTESVTAFISPLRERGWDVRWVEVRPCRQFPFPWPVRRFISIFPACADPEATVDIDPIDSTSYPAPDEILLFAFQVWYLSPSLPMRSVLASAPEAFRGRDVLTVIACRNMWWSAAIDVRRLLDAVGAHYLGTIAASDTSSQFHSLVTTLRWLLAGRRDAFWRFGRAGIADTELVRLRAVGEAVAAAATGGTPSLKSSIAGVLTTHAAAPIYPTVAAADLLGGRAFRIWGTIVRSASRYGVVARAAAIGAFIVFLGSAIVIGFPALAIARRICTEHFDAAVVNTLDRAFDATHFKE